LPLFGSKKKPLSIRDVPDWEKLMNFLTERVGEEFEVALSPLPLGISGKSEHEILRDKGPHTMVYPSSLNDKWKFRIVHYIDEPLAKLDGTGTQLVGTRRSFVNRKFVDAFVSCIGDVYNSAWEGMRVWVLGPTRSSVAPIFLVSEGLTVSIAPYFLGEQRLEPTGKYQYPPTGSARN
jgi:hypothetical protein